jgi:hypothetical protein
LIGLLRCDAHWRDLDHGDAGRRAHQHTEALLEAVGNKSLWDDYGIISDIMVCVSFFLINFEPELHPQPFTYGFPRADIHELLSPDLLHQIIKGTFKDHLVTWVSEYIKAINPPAGAKKILADIDRR